MIVAWVYGTDRLMKNLDEMGVRQGSALRWYWTVCWRFVCPAVLAVLVGSTLYEMVPKEEEEEEAALDHVTPRVLRWLMHLLLLGIIPAFAVAHVVKRWRNGGELQRARQTKMVPRLREFYSSSCLPLP